MMRLQNDPLDHGAQLVPLLRDVTVAVEAAERARQTLLAWNFVLDKESVAAGIYEAWHRRLADNVSRELVFPAAAQPFLGPPRVWNSSLARGARRPLRQPSGAGRDTVLARVSPKRSPRSRRSLAPTNALDLRTEPVSLRADHTSAERGVSPEMRRRLDVGPSRGRRRHTVSATGTGGNQTAGASFASSSTFDWDDRGTNTPGQSGDPDSPHYRDLFELWARGKYFPIFYTRTKVESVVDERLTLQPAAAGRQP